MIHLHQSCSPLSTFFNIREIFLQSQSQTALPAPVSLSMMFHHTLWNPKSLYKTSIRIDVVESIFPPKQNSFGLWCQLFGKHPKLLSLPAAVDSEPATRAVVDLTEYGPGRTVYVEHFCHNRIYIKHRPNVISEFHSLLRLSVYRQPTDEPPRRPSVGIAAITATRWRGLTSEREISLKFIYYCNLMSSDELSQGDHIIVGHRNRLLRVVDFLLRGYGFWCWGNILAGSLSLWFKGVIWIYEIFVKTSPKRYWSVEQRSSSQIACPRNYSRKHDFDDHLALKWFWKPS